jgi:hypothetical protein
MGIRFRRDKRNKLRIEEALALKLDKARQRFRLTSAEKRVVVFILAAFVLGLFTKCYRDAHPSPPLSQSDSRQGSTSNHLRSVAFPQIISW